MKKHLYLLLFCFSFISPFLYGQSEFYTQYNNVYTSDKRCLLQLSDSGFIVAGQYPNPSYLDRTLTRLDKYGNIIWEKVVVVASNHEYSNAIKITSNDRIVVVGYAGSGISITHFDLNGNILFNKFLSLSLSGASGNYNFDIIESPDSSIYILARNYIIKTDLIGNNLWIKQYNLFLSEFTNIHCISDNKFILTGNASNIIGINSFVDLVQVCIDSLGVVQWGKVFGNNSQTNEIARSSVLTNDNKIIIFAYNPNLGSFILATDTSGNQLWCKGKYEDFSSFLPIILNDESIVAASKSTIDGKINIFKFNSNGDLITRFSIQNPSTLTSIAGLVPTSDNGFYIETHSSLSNNNRIGIKFNQNFNSNCIQSNLIQNLPQSQRKLDEVIILKTPTSTFTSSVNSTPSVISLTPSIINFCSSTCDVIASFTPAQTKVCKNSTINFTNTSLNATSYKWYINDSLISIAPSINYSFNDTGTYIVKLLSMGLSCTDSSYCQVEVESLPTPGFNYNKTNLKVLFQPLTTNNLIEWDCGDSSLVNTNHEYFTHYYKSIGNYNVCLKESNTCGENQYCNQIELLPEDSLDFIKHYNYNINAFEDQSFSSAYSSADGGWYVVGTDDSYGSAGRKGLIIKTNKFGSPLRTNIVDFPYDFHLKNVIETYNGDIVLSGNNSDVPARVYFGRVDSSGNNSSYISISSNASEIVVKPIELKNGDLILSGNTGNNGFIMQTDATLNIKWYRKFAILKKLRAVIKVQDGYLLAGQNTSNELTVLKIDLEGDFVWIKSYNLGGAASAYDIIESKDSNILITGYVTISSNSRAIILKITPVGDHIWCSSYIPAFNNIYGNSISENNNGNIFISLINSGSNIDIFQTDSLGDVLWGSKFTQLGRGQHITTQDDGIIIPASVNGSLSYRPSLIKLTSNQQPLCLATNASLTKSNLLPTTSSLLGIVTSTIPSINRSYSNLFFSTTDTLICSSSIPIVTNINNIDIKNNSSVNVYPNPFNNSFTIGLDNHSTNAFVNISSIENKIVYQSTFNNRIKIDASTWNKGIYIIKIIDTNYQKTLKLIKQ